MLSQFSISPSMRYVATGTTFCNRPLCSYHSQCIQVFQLFDNVLLLGQGGMTVYYGPTSGMEDYFAKRGFLCPSFSNPADFYMDVLSGIIPHPDNADWHKEDLFEEWMCADENPNKVSREEAKSTIDEIRNEDAEINLKNEETDRQEGRFFIGRFCAFLCNEFSMVFKHIWSNVRPDKTGRKTPGALSQTYLLFIRASRQRLRSPFATILNIFLMLIAGSVVTLSAGEDINFYAGIPKNVQEGNTGQEAYLQQNVQPVDIVPATMLSVYFFLLMISCLSVNVYGPERTVFFRDTAVGQSVFSYWVAKTTDTLIWLPIYTCAFVAMGYSREAWLIQPLRSYWVFLFLDIVGFYGFGMLASLLVGPSSAALLALVFGVVVVLQFSCTVSAYGDADSGRQTFTNFWFVFWSTQGLASKEYDQYTYAFNVTRLNDETPDRYNNELGIGIQTVGGTFENQFKNS